VSESATSPTAAVVTVTLTTLYIGESPRGADIVRAQGKPSSNLLLEGHKRPRQTRHDTGVYKKKPQGGACGQARSFLCGAGNGAEGLIGLAHPPGSERKTMPSEAGPLSISWDKEAPACWALTPRQRFGTASPKASTVLGHLSCDCRRLASPRVITGVDKKKPRRTGLAPGLSSRVG
jgi:hypothetical protein